MTGFGPFGRITDNPSSKLARSLDRPFQILEVAFAGVDAFLAQLDPSSFDRWLMLGVAGKRHQVTPEVFARNFVGPVPDVRGERRLGDIEPGAPLLIQSTLWTADRLKPVLALATLHTSLDAGNYLCNYTYYRALRRFPEKQIGFVHVPPEEALSLDHQRDVVQALIALAESPVSP